MADTVDPLAGGFAVEAVTDQVEEEIQAIVDDYESRGGIVPFIESGEIQRLLARQAYEHQRKIAEGEQVWVGVNKFASEDEDRMSAGEGLYEADDSVLEKQKERLAQVKAARDAGEVAAQLERLARACESKENLVPYLMDAARARLTVGEMTGVMRGAFGAYVEPSVV